MSAMANSSESEQWISGYRSSSDEVPLLPGNTADYEDPGNFSIFKFTALIAAIILCLKLAEKWMSTRDKGFTFVRPAFLVNSGLNFGINGCGALLVIAGMLL